MPDTALKDYIEPYPGIRDFIFVPPPVGESRTWIYCAVEDPQSILNYHFASLMTHGWRVLQNEPTILARRAGTDLSVSTMRRGDESRIVYELRA